MNKAQNQLTITRIAVVFVLFFAVLFTAMFIAGKSYLRSYKVLAEKELVAEVFCEKTSKNSENILRVILYPRTSSAKEWSFFFNADEWIMESRIIQWKPVSRFFGIKRYYRLERVSCRYFDLQKEKNAPRYVYDIAQERDGLWEFVYKFQRFLPFVEAVYGNSAFVPFEPGKTFQVYITSTGLMIKDISVPKKRSWWQVGKALPISEKLSA